MTDSKQIYPTRLINNANRLSSHGISQIPGVPQGNVGRHARTAFWRNAANFVVATTQPKPSGISESAERGISSQRAALNA
jgi:hypothetical protein